MEGQNLYLYSTSKATQYTAYRLAEAPWKKMPSGAVGPFRVLAATQDTVTRDEDGIQNTVSIDRASIAPTTRAPERSRRGDLTIQLAVPEASGSELVVTKKDREAATHEQEYVVTHIVGHRNQKNGIVYHVRWYNY